MKPFIDFLMIGCSHVPSGAPWIFDAMHASRGVKMFPLDPTKPRPIWWGPLKSGARPAQNPPTGDDDHGWLDKVGRSAANLGESDSRS